MGYESIVDWSIYAMDDRVYEFLIILNAMDKIKVTYTRGGHEASFTYGNFLMDIKGILLAIQENKTWKNNKWFQDEWELKNLQDETNFIFWLMEKKNQKVFANLVTNVKIFVKRVKVRKYFAFLLFFPTY